MAFIPVPNCASVFFNFQALGAFAGQVHLDFRTNDEGEFAPGLFNNMAETIQDYFTELGDTIFYSPVEDCNVLMRALNTQFSYVETYPINVGPAAAQPMGPQQAVFCLKFSTGLAGRSYRGRIYHGWLPEASYTNGIVTNVAAEAILGFWGGLVDAVETNADITHVVISRFTNGAPRSTAIATDVTGVSYTKQGTSTQRRRAKYHI